MSDITDAQAIKNETETSLNTADRVGSLLEALAGRTGWIDYVDTQYTSGTPLSLTADTDTLLPNNAGTVVSSNAPKNGSTALTLYDGNVITGREGDGLSITLDFKALPTSGAATYLEVWFDITGGSGTPTALANLYKRLITFPKGSGEERPVNFTVATYSLDTWEANGAVVKLRSNGPVSIYDIRFILHRTHKSQL